MPATLDDDADHQGSRSARDRPGRRQPPVGAKIALLLVGFALGLAVLELGIRFGGLVTTDDLLPFAYRREDLARIVAGDSYLQFDADVGWSPRPSTARHENGALYRTNAAGQRSDREYSVERPPGVTRVATFGDSFTHCDEVANPDCWAAVLERRWQGSEILNFGVPAAGPDQAWLRYQRDGRPYKPCGVVIGYMVENINRAVGRFFPFYQPLAGTVLSKPRFALDGDGLALVPNPVTNPADLSDPVWVERTLGPGDRWYVPHQFTPHPLDFLWSFRAARTALYHRHALGLQGTDPTFLKIWASGTAWNGMGDLEYFDQQLARAYRPETEAFQVTSRVLVSFAREVTRDGGTPVVVIFGRRQEAVLARHRLPRFYQPLRDALDAAQIPTIDVSDALARAANRRGMEQLFGSRGHYSAEVNRIVAEELAARIPGMMAPTCGPA